MNINLEIIKDNFRVEVYWSNDYASAHFNENEAKGLARYIESLKDIKAVVVWDTHYKCPNCKMRAVKKEDLVNCCEENVE
ncbi:hypothetical protein HYS94_02145 [Candidatus Daviesbacteria bacterium]|nr:hypothetical protein [Candidatus Daviesbacteria bacterium]